MCRPDEQAVGFKPTRTEAADRVREFLGELRPLFERVPVVGDRCEKPACPFTVCFKRTTATAPHFRHVSGIRRRTCSSGTGSDHRKTPRARQPLVISPRRDLWPSGSVGANPAATFDHRGAEY